MTGGAPARVVHAASPQRASRSWPGGELIRSSFVLTISDGVAAGSRSDESGQALTDRLAVFGFAVERGAVPDDPAAVVAAVQQAIERGHQLIVTSGGTGLGPRDSTPQALRPLLDYEIPGFGEAMRAAGRSSTPMADLSRSFAGVIGNSLLLALPGSPAGALESLSAVQPILGHALDTLGGQTSH